MKNILFLILVALCSQSFGDSKHYKGIVSYLLDVAKGSIPGETIVNKFGSNAGLTTTTDSQTVWPGSGFYPFTPDTAQAMDAVSSSAQDSGVRVITGLVRSGSKTGVTIRGANFIDTGVVVKDLFINDTKGEYSVIIAVDSFSLTLLGMGNGSQVQRSSSSNDKNDVYRIIHTAGTGAGALVVYGLDSNWLFQTEVVRLSGLDTVDLTKRYIRQWRASVLNVGTGGSAAGLITVQDSGGGDTACIVASGANQTQQMFFTVPGDKDGYLLGGYVALGKGAGATATSARFSWRARLYGGAGNTQGEIELVNTGAGYFKYIYQGAPPIPPRTDIEIICEYVSGTTGVQAGMDILLSDR